jgi:hypothetical protein
MGGQISDRYADPEFLFVYLVILSIGPDNEF